MHADVDGFLAHLQVERRMSVHTLDAYRRDLGALADWTGTQARGDLRGLQGDDIRAFVAAGHRGGLSPKSLQRRLSACRSFYQWLLKHGHIVANPAAGVGGAPAPPPPTHPPPVRSRKPHPIRRLSIQCVTTQGVR